VLRGQLQERNHKVKPTKKTKSSRFDALVERIDRYAVTGVCVSQVSQVLEMCVMT
jgi:hypothetical protein